METKDIIANNVLIAEFMGAKIEIEDGRYNVFNWDNPKDYPLKYVESCGVTMWGTEQETLDKIKTSLASKNGRWGNFTYDWNDLMLCVEKIEGLDNNEGEFDCSFEISNGNTCVIAWHGETLIDLYSSSKIEAVYNAVLEFIKWYNLNT